eukprot:scaffold8363_cov163-Amphora_coffeaeformis.AAC.12
MEAHFHINGLPFEPMLLSISPTAGRILINRPPFKSSSYALLNGEYDKMILRLAYMIVIG